MVLPKDRMAEMKVGSAANYIYIYVTWPYQICLENGLFWDVLGLFSKNWMADCTPNAPDK